MFTVLFTTAEVWKQPVRVLADEWMMKICYIHTMDYYSAMRKKEVPLVTCINLESIMPNEVSQKDYYSDFMDKQNLKKKKKIKFIENREKTVICQR